MVDEKMPAKLCRKMAAEQERYRKWLLGQPPDKMLTHALEYAIREGIVEIANEDKLHMTQVGPLLKSRTPLAGVFRQWKYHRVGYLEGIRDAFERSADVISYNQRKKAQRGGR